MDLEAIEKDKYRRMYVRQDYRQNSPGQRYWQTGMTALEARGADRSSFQSVCDFGCGLGRAAAMFLARGYAATGIDIAPNAIEPDIAGRVQFIEACLWDLPTGLGPFDWGYCSDVMEHIPPEKVDDVLANISANVRGSVFFGINKVEAHGRHGELIGVGTLHLSCHPADWWMNALGRFFDNVELLHDDPRECYIIADGRAGR